MSENPNRNPEIASDYLGLDIPISPEWADEISDELREVLDDSTESGQMPFDVLTDRNPQLADLFISRLSIDLHSLPEGWQTAIDRDDRVINANASYNQAAEEEESRSRPDRERIRSESQRRYLETRGAFLRLYSSMPRPSVSDQDTQRSNVRDRNAS